MNKGVVLLSQEDLAPWQALHEELSGSAPLAGIFRGWIPSGFHDSKARILYVGKATSGTYQGPSPESCYFNGKYAFWDFARQVAVEAGASRERLECIAWSNISKIALPQIKAESSLISGFAKQACLTLEKEIEVTKCNVVVFVTAHFNDQVVAHIGQTRLDSEWSKSESESDDERVHDIWWRKRTDGVAVLAMRHPMGASRVHRTFAARKIAQLAGCVTLVR